MIFTDGQPIRRPGEDAFGDEYSDRNYGERWLADDTAKSLRDKHITVISLATGTESTLRRFREDIKGWSTKYFETKTANLSSITTQLISASCVDSGMEINVFFLVQGSIYPVFF